MKRTFFLFLIATLLYCPLAQAQTDQIKLLEREIRDARGNPLINKSIFLAKLYMDAGEFDKAVRSLNNAAKESKKIGQKEQIAVINFERARIIFAHAPHTNKYLKEAFEAIKESLDKEVQSLEAKNLDLLSQIENAAGQNDLKQKARTLIAEVNTRRIAIANKLEQKAKDEEFKEFKRQGETEKFEEIQRAEAALESIKASTAELEQQANRLVALSEDRQIQINQLSEEQAKSELLIIKSERMLDSMRLVAFRDSLTSLQDQQIMQDQQFELERQTSQLQLKESQQKFSIALIALIMIVAGFLYMRFNSAQKHGLALEAKNEIIESEKEKSDRLLLNILPGDVAEELKEKGKVKTQFFSNATVLFADFVKFSKIASSVSPEKLIEDLDYCFSKFDEIVSNHGIERIKTIGDAYMCVSGVPKPVPDHAPRMVRAAKEMQAFLEIWNASRKGDNLPEFRSRIGIHSGPVIAGVVGTTKFAYDIWGDSVNIADRMQDSGEAGEINISKSTQQLLNGDFDLEYRGKLQIKNMADIDGYFVRV